MSATPRQGRARRQGQGARRAAATAGGRGAACRRAGSGPASCRGSGARPTGPAAAGRAAAGAGARRAADLCGSRHDRRIDVPVARMRQTGARQRAALQADQGKEDAPPRQLTELAQAANGYAATSRAAARGEPMSSIRQKPLRCPAGISATAFSSLFGAINGLRNRAPPDRDDGLHSVGGVLRRRPAASRDGIALHGLPRRPGLDRRDRHRASTPRGCCTWTTRAASRRAAPSMRSSTA